MSRLHIAAKPTANSDVSGEKANVIFPIVGIQSGQEMIGKSVEINRWRTGRNVELAQAVIEGSMVAFDEPIGEHRQPVARPGCRFGFGVRRVAVDSQPSHAND